MTKEKVFLIVQSALCILIAVLLGAAAISIFTQGSAWQAAGHPSDWIFTREKAAAGLMPAIPLIVISFALTVCGIAKGIKDEDAGKPVKDEELTQNISALRARAEDPNKAAPEAKHRNKLVWRALMVLAVCFVIIGIFNGSMKDVLVKAIKICTECVGLG